MIEVKNNSFKNQYKTLNVPRNSYKSFKSESNSHCHSISTSTQLFLELTKNFSKEINYNSNYDSEINISNPNNSQNENEKNNDNENDDEKDLIPVRTIIVNENLSEECINGEIENLNQTSSFIRAVGSNNLNVSLKSKTNSEAISRIGTDKITFKNNNFDNENEDLFSKFSYSDLNSVKNYENKELSKLPSLISLKRNNTDHYLKVNYYYENIKRLHDSNIKKGDSLAHLFSQMSDNVNVQKQNSKKSKQINLEKIIPIESKVILLKKYYEYLQTNIPIIYSKDTDNNIINGFSGFTYKNDSSKSKTKISININLNNEHGIFNFFSLYDSNISEETINSKYKELSKNKLINSKYLFEDIFRNILLLKFQNNIFSICRNDIKNKNQFCYKAFFSIDNSKKIHYLNIEQKIRIKKKFDFLILLNKGIFNFLSIKDLCKIIYNTLKIIIIQKESYYLFLECIIKNIFKTVIENGGKKDMACIFLCFPNLKKLYEKANLQKIDDILNELDNIIYNVEDECNNLINANESIDSLKISLTPKVIANPHNNTISFKEKKSFNSVIDNYSNILKNNNNVNMQKIKKKNFLKCCGFFC
jgi:hypothetical protein